MRILYPETQCSEFATKLIEEAGLKELRANGFRDLRQLLHGPSSAASQILDLIDLLKAEALRKFGTELKQEISYIRPCNFSGLDPEISKQPTNIE